MIIKIRNNPMFADFLGERLARRFMIESMIYHNKEDWYKTFLIPQHKRDYALTRQVITHLLRMVPIEPPDRSGFKGAAMDFMKNEAVNLS